MAISLFALSFFYERLFHIEAELVVKGRILLLIYAVSSMFVWVVIPFQGVLKGFQRMDIISKVSLVISIFNIPLALIVLTYSGSYLFYIALLQFITVVVSCVNIVVAIKLIPNFRFRLRPIPRSLRDKLIKFSGWYFVASIFGLIIYQIDNLIIGAILGVNAVAVYSIAFIIHTYIRRLNALLGSPLYPVIVAEFAKQNKNNRDAMVINATRIHSGILIPIVIIALISVDDFILAWVGVRFSGSILPCKILLSYWFFNIMIAILSQAVVGGKGKIIEPVRINGFVAVANLGLSLLLIRFIGITGVAWGTAIPWILASNFYVFRYCRILSISVLDFLRKAVVPNVPHFFLCFFLSFIAQRFMKGINVFQIITIMAFIYGITQVVGYNLLSPDNRRIIKRLALLRF